MNSTIQIYLKQKLAHLLLLIHQTKNSTTHQSLLQIHSQLITTGFHFDQSWLLPLLEQLFLCASTTPSATDHVTLIFNQIQQPNVATCRLMIRGLNPSQSLCFFRQMQSVTESNNSTRTDEIDDPFLLASVIKACGKLNAVREGKSVHCHVLRRGLDYSTNVINTLMHFYSNSVESIHSSCTLFEKIPHRTIVTFNSMMSGFMKHRIFDAGLRLFIRVLSGLFDLGLKPNDVMLVILISGCTELGNLVTGRTLHSYCSKTMLSSSTEVSNALMNLYSKFDCVDEAVRLFDELPERDLISWNTIISGYIENNCPGKGIIFFKEMRSSGLEGDNVTLVNLISACRHSRDEYMGKSVHAYLKIRGMGTNYGPIGTSLITMYSKLGLIQFARNVFDEIEDQNIITWNSMISGYVECGCFSEALKLFHLLQMEKLRPDEVTMLELVSACRNLGELNHGRRIHSYVLRYGFDGNILLCNALIDMYAKCGSMKRAMIVFNKMPKRDVITWTSIIVGHAINGAGKEALDSFQEMCDERIEPNSVTFIGVLLACDHAGLVDEGKKFYKIMCNFYRIQPKIEHYGCIVDMLARAGLLEEAHEFVKRMPSDPNSVMRRMLIGGCRVHGDFDLGLRLIGGITQNPEDFVLSSNIFAETEKWNDVLDARRLMSEKQVVKKPGQSLLT